MSTINLKKNIWAYGIVASFLLFMSLMIGFAILAGRHKVNLVVTDYYKAEIEYQQRIDKEANTNALAQKPDFSYNENTAEITLNFPLYLVNDGVTGTVQFYRPSSPEKDFFITLSPDEKTGMQTISVKDKKHGLWRLKLDWQTNGIGYYYEEALTLK